MRLQPLEGIGMEEEDAKPTVALSLAGKSGLPVLIIAGEKRAGGRGGRSAVSGEEVDKELELMALPRSEEQRSEDAQVTVSFGGKSRDACPHCWGLAVTTAVGWEVELFIADYVDHCSGRESETTV